MTHSHTKGPWHYDVSETAPDCFEIRNNIIEIAQVDRLLDVSPEDEDGNSEGEANARLIAAAPVMSSKLNAIVARIEGVFDDADLMSFGALSTNALDDILAIAKATGAQ